MFHDISEFLGKTVSGIEVNRNDNDEHEIVFSFEGGDVYKMCHVQDCSECVEIEDICGDLDDLIGAPITEAEEVTSQDKTPDVIKELVYSDSYTWTFYKIGTNKGSVTIRWFGESNGYYSESVDIVKVA